MTAMAAATLIFVLSLTVWAISRTGAQTLTELGEIWRTGPWPKQIVGDFYSLARCAPGLVAEHPDGRQHRDRRPVGAERGNRHGTAVQPDRCLNSAY